MADHVHHPSNLAELQELLASHPLVIVDFFATWCQPCTMIAPFFADLAREHADLAPTLAFAKVNFDESPDIVDKYEITAMPTFLFLHDGKQEHPPLRGANPPVLARIAGLFVELARAKQAEAASKTDEPKKEEGDDGAEGEKKEEEAGEEPHGHDTRPVSGGYSLGTRGGKRDDWKLSLDA